MSHAPVPPEVDRMAKVVVDAVYSVHRNLGPGLLESVYEACLAHKLRKREVPFQAQLSLPVIYDGERLDAGLRLDLLVGDCLIVELKSAEKMIPLYDAQVLTYLKLTGHRLGLLVNFNVPLIKDGIRRIVL
jgi:GxxExxY protein